MEGFLVLFNSNSRKELTKINHLLFGRIVYTAKENYYYCGELENIPYCRLTNGCYFISREIPNGEGLLTLLKGNIELNNNVLLTAKEYWKAYSERNKLSVKNL